LDIREWDLGIAGPRRLAVDGHFSPIPDSGPRTALRARCCLPLRVVFLVSPSASWPTGCQATIAGGVRGRGGSRRVGSGLSERDVFCEEGKDGVGFSDAGHDPKRAATVDARAHVNVEEARQALRLRRSSGAFRRGCGGRCWPGRRLRNSLKHRIVYRSHQQSQGAVVDVIHQRT